MEEEGADGEPEEVFDEGARVLIEAFDYGVVHQSGDYSKIQRKEGHDGLEDSLCKPEGAEGGKDHDQGEENEGDVVSFHDGGVLSACGRLMDEVDGLLGGEFLAVVAAEHEVLFVDDVEFGGDGFAVGDALGVGAFDEVLDVVGDFGGEFLDDFVVLDGDDGDEGRYEGHFAHFVFGEVFVFDFDDTFAAELGALQVVADKHFVFVFFKAEDMDDLVDGLGGDMVDDGAVLDGGDDEFFLCVHGI